jgi:hypothetical protein
MTLVCFRVWEPGHSLFPLVSTAKTIVTYRSWLMIKLGTEDIPDLVKFVIQHGLTTLE